VEQGTVGWSRVEWNRVWLPTWVSLFKWKVFSEKATSLGTLNNSAQQQTKECKNCTKYKEEERKC
jgi:hypothetical protein